MSKKAGVEDVCAGIEASARLLDIACPRDAVRPILNAYRDAIAEAVIVFAMAGGRHARELDYSISVPSALGDPYAIALANGFAAETDHSVGVLQTDIAERCAIGMYAIDCGVVGGFKKTYQFFAPTDLPTAAKLADIPSMPPGVAESVAFLERHGVADSVTMTSIDYQNRSVNLYLGNLAPGCLAPGHVASMLGELGLPEPSGQVLEFVQRSFAIYPTFSWDSSKIERLCFAVITTDPMALPSRLAPELGRFASNAPHSNAGERTLVYGVTLVPGEEYYKVGSYYQINPETRKLVKAFDAIED